MSVRRSLSVSIACMIGLLLLTGCITTVAPARALSSTGGAGQVAVAVQSNGIKHYAWTECSNSACQLVYQRIKVGAPIYQYTFRPAAGTQIQHPDVAVTADGRAFLVHNLCSSTCIDYYSVIPADATDTTVITLEQLASPGANSAGQPKLKARDNVVYATYFVEDDPNPRLRYRQLSGGLSGGYVDIRPSALLSDPSLAIGNNGTLYVAWKATDLGTREIVYSSNLGTGGDFNSGISYDPFGNYNFYNPDIALDPNNTPYIVYAYMGEAGDTVKIVCQTTDPNACFGGVIYRTIPLNGAQNPWRLRGNPHIQVLGSSPAVVFSADNNATANNEIWYYTPPSSGIDPGPSRVTNNNIQDDEPSIVVENSNFGDTPVVAWRTYVTVTAPFPGIPIDCARDGYVFHFDRTTLRRVFESTGGCFNFAQDFAASGPWVAGVWLDRLSSAESTLVPWTLFNANTVYTPITAR